MIDIFKKIYYNKHVKKIRDEQTKVKALKNLKKNKKSLDKLKVLWYNKYISKGDKTEKQLKKLPS